MIIQALNALGINSEFSVDADVTTEEHYLRTYRDLTNQNRFFEWSVIQAKIAELTAAEPMRLLRIQRNQLLQQTDWEINRGLEEGLNIDSLKTYRTALRNLPQQIEAGEITAPTLDDNGVLVFEHWPERTDA